jgi:protein-S-isoprenylcysteine O-methyltransferase Ste14
MSAIPHPAPARAFAVTFGLFTHALFGVAVGSMVLGLATGMQTGLGQLDGSAAWAANAALALQFPLLHTWTLSRRGGRVLGRALPSSLRRDLATTLYSAWASLQVLVTFVLWSPSGVTWWRAEGAVAVVSYVAYGLAWLLLGKAMWDASLALQTGALGWWAVARGRAPVYPPMPTRGLFARWRQPIYTAFAATLVTGPVWTPDRLLLVVVWGVYCLVGPRFKERRYAGHFGDAFAEYRRSHPYWLPRLGRRRTLRAAAEDAVDGEHRRRSRSNPRG